MNDVVLISISGSSRIICSQARMLLTRVNCTGSNDQSDRIPSCNGVDRSSFFEILSMENIIKHECEIYDVQATSDVVKFGGGGVA